MFSLYVSRATSNRWLKLAWTASQRPSFQIQTSGVSYLDGIYTSGDRFQSTSLQDNSLSTTQAGMTPRSCLLMRGIFVETVVYELFNLLDALI